MKSVFFWQLLHSCRWSQYDLSNGSFNDYAFMDNQWCSFRAAWWFFLPWDQSLMQPLLVGYLSVVFRLSFFWRVAGINSTQSQMNENIDSRPEKQINDAEWADHSRSIQKNSLKCCLYLCMCLILLSTVCHTACLLCILWHWGAAANHNWEQEARKLQRDKLFTFTLHGTEPRTC